MTCAACRYWRRAERLRYGHCFAPARAGEPFWLAAYREQEQRYELAPIPRASIWIMTHPRAHGADCAARRP